MSISFKIRCRYFIWAVIFGSCLYVSTPISSFAQNLRYGLGFSSFEVVQEKRTSLNLSPFKNLFFSNGFSLSFNMFLHAAPEYNFGYVFRIIGKNNQHLDFLATPDKLTVVNSEDKVLADVPISEASRNFSDFFLFQLDLDIKSNTLKISIGGKEFSNKIPSLESFNEVGIFFGKCNHPQYLTSDVPKMIIKDIRINNIDKDSVYYWKLSKHVKDGVYDELKNQFAKVENPQWLLDTYAFWNKKISFKTLRNPQIAYNSDDNTIAVADRRSFFVYKPLTNNLLQNYYSSGFVHSDSPNQLVYNPLDSTYYSYCFSRTDGSNVASYNVSNHSWNNNNFREINKEFWHHNRFFSRKEDCIYLFGGYGQHQYKNIVNKYSFKTGKWEKLQFRDEQIPPRYLSGLGVIDENRILIFGGYGSISGQQFLSPKNYYDLYQVNIPDLTVRKIWEMEPPKDKFAISNSMIVDTLNKCFYALCFPQNQYETTLLLTKFSLQKPGYEVVSDSIPFYFNDILSYADLFQNKKTGELYAITFSALPTDSLSTVSIYSLVFPPLEQIDVYQHINNMLGLGNSRFLFIVICTFLVITSLFVYLYLRKKKIKYQIEQENESTIDPLTGAGKEDATIAGKDREINKKQAIILFGGFKVKDKEGVDKSREFTPMLRQLFLLILLNTFDEDRRGISSIELDDTIWPNRNHITVKNTRSVMISMLRKLFENVGQMNIELVNSHWIVKLSDDIYCDYSKALSYMQNLKNGENRKKEEVMKLLNIVSSGELLPDIQVEWVDSFKANFANELIDLLLEVSKRKEYAFSPTELISIADTLLIYDVLNDDALKLKCKSLIKIGKNGLAQTTYNSFVKQYKILFGDQYKYTFSQIIS